ncbi:MAG: phosphoribosylformylglycinamidine synthase subunit PurS, partial [Planctomycetales bacterium]
MLWEVDIYPSSGQPNLAAARVKAEAVDLGLTNLQLEAGHGFLIEGRLSREQVERIATELLADSVVERTVVAEVGDPLLSQSPKNDSLLVHVLLKPGVMDPVAESTAAAISDMEISVDAVRTLHKYWLPKLPTNQLDRISSKILANDAIEQVIVGPLDFDQLQVGTPYQFQLQHVAIRDMDDDELMKLSISGQLFLQLAEMQTIQSYYQQLDREPTDIELETLA